MELDFVPENVLLKILSNLDLLDIVRCGRVCHRWQFLCQIILEREIRVLNFTAPIYWRLNPESLASILHWCAGRVNRIELPILKKSTNTDRTKPNSDSNPDPRLKMNVARWCGVLSEFRFGNLKYINLGDASTDRNGVETLFVSNPNLEIFKWSTPDPNGLEFGGQQPFPWACSALREINLGCLFATDALFNTVGKSCPNLERLTANSYFRQWTAAGLDRFCQSCPQLKILNLKVSAPLTTKGIYVVPVLFDPPKLATDLTHFWELRKLQFLSLPFEGGIFDDHALYRLSICFPELRTLKFGDSRLSSEGLANLRRLRCLKSLTMASVTGQIDEGLLEVASAGHLQELNLALTHIIFPTVLAILSYSPNLRSLNLIRSISNYLVHRGTNINVQQAVQIIKLRQQMAEMGNCTDWCTLIHNDQPVWTSGSVRSAMEKMGQSGMLRVVPLSEHQEMEEVEIDECDENMQTREE